MRDANPDMRFGDITKKVSDQWKALTKEEKVPYEEMAAQDKQRYEKEKKAYEEKQDKDDEKDEGDDAGEDEDEEEDGAKDANPDLKFGDITLKMKYYIPYYELSPVLRRYYLNDTVKRYNRPTSPCFFCEGCIVPFKFSISVIEDALCQHHKSWGFSSEGVLLFKVRLTKSFAVRYT